MNRSYVTLGVAALVLIAGIIWVLSGKDAIFDAEKEVVSQRAQLDACLWRQAALTTDLIAVVKKHSPKADSGALENARKRLLAAKDAPEKAKAAVLFSDSLSKFLTQNAVTRELFEDADFISIREDFSKNSDALVNAVKCYNWAVKNFNGTIGDIPASLFATGMGYTPQKSFDTP